MDAPLQTTDEPGPLPEAIRIQAAAIVAQQAALTEQEMRLREREAALARQEEQLAARLEGDRRQLLDLQDQITDARSALREKRTAHAALAEQQARELAQVRDETAERLSEAKADRHRLLILRDRMKRRWHRHWLARRREVEAESDALRREKDRLASDRAALAMAAERFHGQAELDKRQFREERAHLAAECKALRAERAEYEADRKRDTRDWARRVKALAAAERHLVAERAAHDRALADGQRELESLESRIGNARRKLLEHQGELLQLGPTATVDRRVPLPELPVASNSSGDDSLEAQWRGQTLAQIAGELADQRLLLAEQAERLLSAHQGWCAERTAAIQELESLGEQLGVREQQVDRREQDLRTARDRLKAETQALAVQKLRLDAERARTAADDSDRRSELTHLQSVLDARQSVLNRRETSLAGLYRRWGRRRSVEVRRLRVEQEACRQERAEWAAARSIWLRAGRKLDEERRAVAASALALEQWRQQSLGQESIPPAAAKRLERLRRQWAAYCANSIRELEYLRATLGAEAVRLDEHSRNTGQERLAATECATRLDDRAADLERTQVHLESEQATLAEHVIREQLARERADRQVAGLRDEVERLARLLIDAPPAPSVPQAA